MQNEKIIEEFLEDMRIEGRTESTISEYRHRLIVIFRYFSENSKNIYNLENADIKTFSKDFLQSGKKISTLRGHLSVFCVFNKWGINKGVFQKQIVSPDDYPKSTRTQRIKRLNDEEIKIFKSYIDNLQENARAAFYLMLGSGCRVGEVAHLRPEDVTLRGKAVYIDIKDAKWGSDRCIPIVDEKAAKIVWKYRTEVEVDNRPLFRLSKRTLQGYATTFARKTGITFRCHLLRHTFAALLTEKGVPLTTVQYLLGHKSLGMTAHYASSALVDMKDIESNFNL